MYLLRGRARGEGGKLEQGGLLTLGRGTLEDCSLGHEMATGKRKKDRSIIAYLNLGITERDLTFVHESSIGITSKA